MNPLIQLKQTTSVFLVAFGLACFGLSPMVRAVSPPPEGGYPGGNTAEGQSALLNLTTGGYNTAVGFLSLRSNTSGGFNTAIGAGTLFANTGSENTALGAGALLSNTTGDLNTANGVFALFNNTTGTANTATGSQALFSNTAGSYNTANGAGALHNNTADNNTAVGVDALHFNTTGIENVANGVQALYSNTTGSGNIAIGFSMFSSTTGSNNIAVGDHALNTNTTGDLNTGVGYHALLNTAGPGNTAVGYLAGSNVTTGSDNIDIGNEGGSGDSGVIRIGRGIINATYITGISGAAVVNGVPVLVDFTGKLGTVTASESLREEIKPMEQTSGALFALKPVTFHYKKEIDPAGAQQFGLVAEEVEKVNSDLVVRDKEGKPYTVRYEAVNAMLLNEFLKEHKAFVEEQGKVQEQGATIARLEQQVAALTAGLQKVSAQLELSKTAPQAVLNNQ